MPTDEELQEKFPILFEERYKADKVILDFEDQCKKIKHKHCHTCKSVSINLSLHHSSRKKGVKDICKDCHKKAQKAKGKYNPILPTWIDDNNNVRYDLPKELTCLREAEKLLICQYLPFIPLHHLKKGQLGMKGHVCCFLQDVDHVCTTLPRMPSDVRYVRVIRTFKDSSGEISKQAFVVRKQVVLDALKWLKKHSLVYKNIIIQESNLDWIENGVEQEIPTVDIIDDSPAVDPSQLDCGPSQTQIPNSEIDEEFINGSVSGSSETSNSIKFQGDDNKEVSSTLEEALKQSKSNKKETVEWPYVSQTAVSEYSKDTNLFPKAFPWLFPGGVGGFHQQFEETLDCDSWALRMMSYEDGRFAKDKYFGFFTHNFCTRRRVQSQGGYYVKSFLDDGLKTLNEIKADLKKGKTEWVDKITYYSKNLKGTSSFWRSKRQEVYSWINYHVSKERMPPMFFITLSCAEYHWPDINRLLKERMNIAGKSEEFEKSSYTNLVNTYTLVIQEYFQKRFEIWMNTVGKEVFKIKHHWAKFEFAPSRGQVHVHLLAICDFPEVQQIYFENKTKKLRALLLQKWMEKQFLFTSGDETLEANGKQNTPDVHPSSQYYSDIPKEDRDLDKARLCRSCQTHKCNAYCLRLPKNKKEG